MRVFHTKIVTIFIVGAAVLYATAVFSADNYNSSKSNTSTAIVNQQVGDILLRYGAGGAEINKVTDALARGISEVNLKVTLIEIGINEKGIQEVFTKLNELGAGADSPKTGLDAPTLEFTSGEVSAPAAGATPQPAAEGTIKEILPSGIGKAVSAPAVGDTPQPASRGTVEEKLPSGKAYNPDQADSDMGDVQPRATGKVIGINRPELFFDRYEETKSIFHDASKNIIQNIRSAAPEERKNLIDELQANREAFQTAITSVNSTIRENAKVLRDNFRERMNIAIPDDQAEKVHIAVAHGKGLRMINRFRSAMARFDHILGRLESRIEKLEAQGVDVSSTVLLIEEAKNMSVENEARMEELKAKYESLLLGEEIVVGDFTGDGRALAKELKTEIEKLHAKLREIVDETKQAMGLPTARFELNF